MEPFRGRQCERVRSTCAALTFVDSRLLKKPYDTGRFTNKTAIVNCLSGENRKFSAKFQEFLDRQRVILLFNRKFP